MKLIDKSAVVAEIKRRIENNTEWKDACKTLAVIAANQAIEEDKKILSIIDTLEVKEVDSKLTLEDISMLRQIMFDYNRQVRNEMYIPNNEDYCKEVLKRFKAQKGEEV